MGPVALWLRITGVDLCFSLFFHDKGFVATFSLSNFPQT